MTALSSDGFEDDFEEEPDERPSGRKSLSFGEEGFSGCGMLWGFAGRSVGFYPSQHVPIAPDDEILTPSGFLSSPTASGALAPSAARTFSASLCGSGGAPLGASGFLSNNFVSLDFSDTPPSVPRVPSAGLGLVISSITPSFEAGKSTSANFSVNWLFRGIFSSATSAFFLLLSALVSTNGPS